MVTNPYALAPCNIFCNACPSFNKTCQGCQSTNTQQKRTSKWGCQIRQCCYNVKNLLFCAQCKQFPCDTITKKLINSHPGEPAFKYRHDIPNNVQQLREQGLEPYLQSQHQRWTCPSCNGQIKFYHYTCKCCGKKVIV